MSKKLSNIAKNISFMETVEIMAPLPQRHNKANIPILENGIAAGFPSPALDYMEKDIDLCEYLIKHPQMVDTIIIKYSFVHELSFTGHR